VQRVLRVGVALLGLRLSLAAVGGSASPRCRSSPRASRPRSRSSRSSRARSVCPRGSAR
jgi:hypothetical protein